jgi:hypothetical protein
MCVSCACSMPLILCSKNNQMPQQASRKNNMITRTCRKVLFVTTFALMNSFFFDVIVLLAAFAGQCKRMTPGGGSPNNWRENSVRAALEKRDNIPIR